MLYFTGDTGPLVYPAGFVYIYTIFYYLTNHGKNIRLAQYCFVGIYLLQMYLVLKIYSKSRKVEPYVLILSAFTSYRIHSIYVLRLFNDPIAILCLYAAINFYLNGNWTLGSIFLSLGVSIKMNILLFAPAILILYIVNLGYRDTIKQLSICAAIQLLLGAPFLLTYPVEYIKGSFDFGRVFEHKWTVNYRFLPIELFENRYFHIALLCVHVILLLIFAIPSYKYIQSYKTSGTPAATKSATQSNPTPSQNYNIHFDRAVQLAILPIFLSNFIGIVCARSLHYQFYVWYFHSLPYLAWFTEYHTSMKFVLLGLIEYAWNTYPSTFLSSALLHFSHLVLLYGIGSKLLRSEQDTQRIKVQ